MRSCLQTEAHSGLLFFLQQYESRSHQRFAVCRTSHSLLLTRFVAAGADSLKSDYVSRQMEVVTEGAEVKLSPLSEPPAFLAPVCSVQETDYFTNPSMLLMWFIFLHVQKSPGPSAAVP